MPEGSGEQGSEEQGARDRVSEGHVPEGHGPQGHELGGRSVFIVEDHARMRQMLRQVLEALPDLRIAGEAVSAEAALEALRDDPRASPPVPSGSSGSGSDEGSPVGPRRVDLLLVDLSLPGMSGLELVKLLHDERPALRCLVVTGHGDPMYREAALAAGAVGFVTKDDPDAVLAAVRTALG